MLTTFQKVLISCLTIVLLGCLGFIMYQQTQLNKKQEAIEKSVILQKDLVDGITRSQSQYVGKDDLDKFGKQLNLNLDAIKKDMSKLDATLTAINTITISSVGYNYTGLNSSYTIPRTTTSTDASTTSTLDIFGYFKSTQALTINEMFTSTTIPIGIVQFSAWRESPWDISVPKRDYQVVTAVGVDEERRMVAYNTFTVVIDGKRYPVSISQALTKQIYPQAKLRFDPRLHFDLNAGALFAPTKFNSTPAFSVNLLSYGKYREQSDFLFAKIGVGYGLQSQKPEFIFTPVSYNIGQHIPFTSGNIYAGASVQINTDAKVTASAQLGVKF